MKPLSNPVKSLGKPSKYKRVMKRMAHIKRVPMNKQVLEGILEILRYGDYSEGDKLPTEKELAQCLGVGRNSIRESLKSLALADIIESIPGKGTFLRIKAVDVMMRADGILNVIQSVSLMELMQVRQIFEVEATYLAAEAAGKNKRALEDFKGAWKRLEHSLRERHDCADEGFEFHNAIVTLSGNTLLKKIMHSIWEELRIARRYTPISEEERFENEIEYHQKVYNAIVDQKPEEAKRIMREHLEKTREIMASLLRQQGL